jgi:hypothetical protein
MRKSKTDRATVSSARIREGLASLRLRPYRADEKNKENLLKTRTASPTVVIVAKDKSNETVLGNDKRERIVMGERECQAHGDVWPDPTRRALLAGLVVGYIASYFPWSFAQAQRGAAGGAFLSVSKILTGRIVLDATQATRLYDALVIEDARFAEDVQALLALINERNVDPLQLQQLLDAEKSPLATVPKRIVTGWYMGIVGSGQKARALAYENALNAVVVSDVLKPPTYCYGEYGSWSVKPR